MKSVEPIIIVGSGLAGYTLARELHKLQHQLGQGGAAETTSEQSYTPRPVMLITADDGAYYSKPQLSAAFSLKKSPEQLVTATAAKLAKQLNFQVLTHTQVREINPEQQYLLADGTKYAYSDLVLACGAKPRQLPVLQGLPIQQINDLKSYQQLRAALTPGCRVGIVGAGLVGCEFANDLVAAGFAVHMIAQSEQPIELLLPEGSGQALQAGLAAVGVHWHLGVTIQAAHFNNGQFTLSLSNSDWVQVDVLISAIGLEPNVLLAKTAGLKVNRGIHTNAMLQTSNDHIYALGDCAEVEGRVRYYLGPLTIGARALAKTLTGSPTPVVYPYLPIFVKTPAHPVVIVEPPPGVKGKWQQITMEEGSKALYLDEAGMLQGYVLTGAATSEQMLLFNFLGTMMTY